MIEEDRDSKEAKGFQLICIFCSYLSSGSQDYDDCTDLLELKVRLCGYH